MTGRIGLSLGESEVAPLKRFRSGEECPSSDREGPSPSTQDDKKVIPLLIKHFARAVNRGQLITCNLGSESVTGYIAGHDDASIFLLVPGTEPDTETPRFARKIVKRAHVTSVDLHDEATFQSEPCRAEMEQILASYRTRMVREVLGRRPPGGMS